jgi:hypothetical protein
MLAISLAMARKLPATEALSQLGYRLVEGRNYQAAWSNAEVEHFISLQGGNSLSGAPPSARFGLRNADADLFAVGCVARYGWAFFQAWFEGRKKSDCPMQFHFSRLDRYWNPVRGFTRLDDPEFAAALKATALTKLLPLVQGLDSKKKLFKTLVSDDEPFRWLVTNGAMRAAIIVALGADTGVEPREIRSELRSKAALISNGLSKHSPYFDTPDDYVAKVQEDWRTWGRGQESPS